MLFDFLKNNECFYEHFLDSPKNRKNNRKVIYYSFGILCYRFYNNKPQILLVQKFNQHRKPHIWGFPKGSPDNNKKETRLMTAKREFLEETQTTQQQRNIFRNSIEVLPNNPIQSSYEGYSYIEISNYFIASSKDYKTNINSESHPEIYKAKWIDLNDLKYYIKKKRYDLIRIAINGYLQLLSFYNKKVSYSHTNLYL